MKKMFSIEELNWFGVSEWGVGVSFKVRVGPGFGVQKHGRS